MIISVSYPATEGSRFDFGYYQSHHMPLVRSLWGPCGLTHETYLRGTGAPGGGPAPVHLTALLTFASADDFARAVELHGKAVMGDIENFTAVRPVVTINEALPTPV